MNVAIVGCGLIGNKRFKALGEHHLVATADTDIDRAKRLGSLSPHIQVMLTDWRQAIDRSDVELVIVAATNNVLAEITHHAIRAGKHVLVEKPAARKASELTGIAKAAQSAGVIVKVGFNHRFHPAFIKARELVDTGALGPMMFARARYGHGGRLGMEKEWRGNPAISGGGEMLDQGVHLIDLARWFLGDFPHVAGHVANYFWKWDVEDNGFALLRTEGGQTAFLHASCTEWKNLFSFELYGRDGKIHVEGLGGSYGLERLSYYRMLPQMGPPETTIWEYPGEDTSWRAEFEHMVDCIQTGKSPSGGVADAGAALEVVEKLYDIGAKETAQ